jgi:hypothetical protein
MANTIVKITGEWSEHRNRQGTLTGNDTGILREVDFGNGQKGMFTKHEFSIVKNESSEDESHTEEKGKDVLTFLDEQVKKTFKSSNFRIEKKNNKTFAIVKSIFGENEIWKALTKKELKNLLSE